VDTAAAALNTTTLSLINRLTAHYKASKNAANFTTLDVMVFRLSQSYDLNVKEEVPGGARRRSPILGELSVVTPTSFTLSANASYDTYARIISSNTVGFGYRIGVVNLSLSEVYIRDPATRFFIGGTSFTLGKWYMSGQWQQDVRNHKTVQEEYGLHYAAQCWGIGMRYTITPGETRFIAMLDLKGIGGRVWGQQ
jgi:lipopolysaccharide assembly outer membrane protein LptD (OstA)